MPMHWPHWPMQRRRFVRIAAFGTAATVAGLAACGPDGDAAAVADLRALARPDLLDVLGEPEVRAIGARYRQMVPGENDAAALRAAIHGRHPLLVRIFGAPRVAPEELVRRDFAEGHTIEVDGWLISVTEARQCALYSLAPA